MSSGVTIHILGGGFKYFYFHPYLGKIPILTDIFQMGWNHQPDICVSCSVQMFGNIFRYLVYKQGFQYVWYSLEELFDDL